MNEINSAESASQTMKHVEYGPDGSLTSLRLATSAPPAPKAGEVLIEVHYAGVNGPDLVQRKGLYPPPPDASPILGLEVAGHIAALGEGVSQWQIGDQVCALVPGGGYAELCTVPAGHVLPVPQGMSLADAAGLPEVWFTVWANLVDMGHVQAGDHVLIHGGAGGVGCAAIQLACHFGAHVFATETSDAKLEVCRAMGAATVINAKTQDFYEAIRGEVGKCGLDIVLDSIGGAALHKGLHLLRRGGRLLIIAFNHGAKVEIDMMPVLTRRLTIAGSTLRARSNEEKIGIRDNLLHQVWPAFAAGKLKTHTHAVLPLEQVADAHSMMEAAAHVGKIILQVRK
ncbi:MAG: NAD(P)H-quinone oxidoreductase [Rhodocyclaceae bacterium]|nr:NAD(P)H-quinone oxidoreductase [Rhodocyclaceae bacterium]